MSRYAILLLDPSTQSFRVGFGDPERTQSDVAHAAGGMSRKCWLFARYVILREDRHISELIRIGLVEASNIREIRDSHKRLRGIERIGAISEMIRAALLEHRESVLCKKCNGIGSINAAPRVICMACDGRGVKPRSDRARAVSINKDHKAYSKYWKDIYEHIYKMLCDWDEDLGRHLIIRLRNEKVA